LRFAPLGDAMQRHDGAINCPLPAKFCYARASVSPRPFSSIVSKDELLQALQPSDSGAAPRDAGTVSPSEASGFSVGIVGTFDVKNYGDLLFPLIAAAALERRDRRIRVAPFSVNGQPQSSWPFEVRTTDEMIGSLPALSAMLIGGGQIVRFDRGYSTPMPRSAGLPFAYWLTPAMLAALSGTPVIWNAVGATTDWPHAAWHDVLLRQVLASSYFIGVRDVVSRDGLAKIAPDADIRLLPDTAFGLSRLWPLDAESPEFTNWRTALGLHGRYIVVQAGQALWKHGAVLDWLMTSMGAINAVILPVCWNRGDRAEEFPPVKGQAFLSREWLHPKLMSEIIARSEFVLASSLHASITALSYGVPAARAEVTADRKYELLDEFEGVVAIDRKPALSRLLDRGRRIEPRVIGHADSLDRYWDAVAEIVLHPPVRHGEFARTVMLTWLAGECGDRRHLGVVRTSATVLRESLAGYFPSQRAAIRRRLLAMRAGSRWSSRAFRGTIDFMRTLRQR
jgi:hypothetical protein